jgi:hypothetical protein
MNVAGPYISRRFFSDLPAHGHFVGEIRIAVHRLYWYLLFATLMLLPPEE